MPKETVATGSDFKIEVVWRRGNFAQIGVVASDGRTFRDILDDSDGDDFDGLWSDVDDEDLARLMKVLRRVRKQLAAKPDRKRDDNYKPML